jgi:hypothetical protein
MFPNHHNLPKSDRDKLKSIVIGSGAKLGEGTAVKLAAFIAPTSATASAGPHQGSPESVNCRITQPDNASDPSWSVFDFHIPVLQSPGDDECHGVVVEMIPQARAQHHPGWTLPAVKAVAQRWALIVGPLFFDNEHDVHDDCSVKNSQPKRVSLWEIHPIIALYLCDDHSCQGNSMSGWHPMD